MAQVAVQQGQLLARNLRRKGEGAGKKKFCHSNYQSNFAK